MVARTVVQADPLWGTRAGCWDVKQATTTNNTPSPKMLSDWSVFVTNNCSVAARPKRGSWSDTAYLDNAWSSSTLDRAHQLLHPLPLSHPLADYTTGHSTLAAVLNRQQSKWDSYMSVLTSVRHLSLRVLDQQKWTKQSSRRLKTQTQTWIPVLRIHVCVCVLVFILYVVWPFQHRVFSFFDTLTPRHVFYFQVGHGTQPLYRSLY